MAPVRVARTSRLPVIAAFAALALSGCMQTASPLASAPPPSDLDFMAYGAPRHAPSVMAAAGSAGAVSAVRASYAAAPLPPSHATPYRLDAGDRLRVVVFGQEGLTNTYAIDAGGSITMPLIGAVPARGRTPAGLAAEITAKLRNGYIREPSVAVEVETYRPFFILGEVTNPGQYPYVPNMTAETAIAIAGGFAPRANKSKVELARNAPGQQVHGDVPLAYPLRPGDTIVVKERWF